MADTQEQQAGVGSAVDEPARKVETAAREIAESVRRRQRSELAQLHRALFSEAGEQRLDEARIPPGLRGRAVSDRFADISVSASVVDLVDAVTRGLVPGPVDPGLVEVHVSVAGHHRSLPRRVRLPPAEEQGWARAVYGPQWEDGAHYSGHTAGLDPIPLAHFTLFLTAGRTPVGPPVWWQGALRPIIGTGPGPLGPGASERSRT